MRRHLRAAWNEGDLAARDRAAKAKSARAHYAEEQPEEAYADGVDEVNDEEVDDEVHHYVLGRLPGITGEAVGAKPRHAESPQN